MKYQDEAKKKLVEYLWVKINRAILDSTEVKICLYNLMELNLLGDVRQYNLMLDVGKLVESMGVETGEEVDSASRDETQDATEKTGAKKTGKKMFYPHAGKTPEEEGSLESGKPRENKQHIDGKPLTQNQILFQEYAQQRFNEKEWMKKAGVRF